MVEYVGHARGTCAGCNEIVDCDDSNGGRPLPHFLEIYNSTSGRADQSGRAPCPGSDHPVKEWPPEGFTGHCQRLKPARWTRLSGSGDPGVEVFLMLDGRICTRLPPGPNEVAK